MWNYAKTPARGVRDLSVYMDGSLIFQTTLRQASAGEHQALLFTNDPALVRRERPHVAYCGAEEQDVLYINDRQVSQRSKGMYDAPNPSAAGVWDTQHEALMGKRPTTSALLRSASGQH